MGIFNFAVMALLFPQVAAIGVIDVTHCHVQVNVSTCLRSDVLL